MALFSRYSCLERQDLPHSVIRDSMGNTMKTTSGNYCTTFIAIQRSDQKLLPFSTVIPVWSDKTPIHRVGIPSVIQGKRPPETSVKLSWRSNGRIKSYGPFQLLFRSGATRPPIHRVGIPWVVQGKRTTETTVKH